MFPNLSSHVSLSHQRTTERTNLMWFIRNCKMRLMFLAAKEKKKKIICSSIYPPKLFWGRTVSLKCGQSEGGVGGWGCRVSSAALLNQHYVYMQGIHFSPKLSVTSAFVALNLLPLLTLNWSAVVWTEKKTKETCHGSKVSHFSHSPGNVKVPPALSAVH